MEHPVFLQIETDFKQHIECLREAVRIPSVSANSATAREMAAWLCRKIQALGADCSLVETGGNPVVYGHLNANAKRTVLFYCLYDVQPANDEGWLAPAFSAEIIDYDDMGPCVIGRGTFNSKGCITGFINTLEAFKRCGEDIPVNVIFMIEGEEELGSPNLPAFIDAHKAELQKADCVFWPYFSEDRAGLTTIKLGSKGMLYIELSCTGGEWGGPAKKDIHPKHSGWVDSPTMELVRAMATLSDGKGGIMIDNALDMLLIPSNESNAMLDSIAGTFNRELMRRELGIKRFAYEQLTDTQLLASHILAPTINIDGMICGYSGNGCQTIMPRTAKAKLDVRLVPNMTPKHFVECLRAHLDRRNFRHIQVDVLSAYPPSQSDPGNPYIAALLNSMHAHAPGKLELWPIDPGCGPEYLFTDRLGIPIAFGGLGHGGNPHSINEYVQISSLIRNEKCNAEFLLKLAQT